MDERNANRQRLLEITKERFNSVVWTHKIQEKQADVYYSYYCIYRIINILVVSLTTSGILSLFWTNELWVKIITCLLAFLNLLTSSFIKNFDYLDKSAKCKNYANELLIIRNKLIIIIFYILNDRKKFDEIENDFFEIDKNLSSIYGNAPITTNKAVVMATKALKDNKEYEYIEKEIDKFLPPSLRGKIKEDIKDVACK